MTILRSLAERFSRGRSFRYRLPGKYGGCSMYLTPEAGLRYWLPKRGLRGDENLLRNAAENVKPGHIVWDVGANMGLFSFAAAGLAGPTGRVYAIEPDATMAQLIRRSARLNPASSPVEAIPCAVSDSISLAQFNIAQRSRTSNALAGFELGQAGGVRQVETVVTVTLDWLAEHIPAPDVLKIDVEGAELTVLRGAIDILKTKRPVVLFELTRRNWSEDSRIFWDLGYTLYDSDLPPAQRVPLSDAPFNVLAVPSSMAPAP
jgi:FkbM family methyltransferase